MINDLRSHYQTQATASFWSRPRNPVLSREVNSYSLARLNEIHRANFKSKAEAVRRILYDGGFCYDGVLPAGALRGDPQFTSHYDSPGAITAYSAMREHLEKDIKARGFDCTGRRQKSLYLQALAGNKTARKNLDALYHGAFPSHPREAWFAIERIIHEVYDSYLRQYGCHDRLCNHPMYPAISTPLPNPVKLRGYIIRARKARDVSTLTWMLGRRYMEPNELFTENLEQLIYNILNRFEYTSTEIAAMRSGGGEQENKANESKESGGFLWGCFLLFAPIALAFGGLYLAGKLMKNHGMVCSVIGFALLLGVLALLIVLCRVFRGKKGRPP